MTVGALNKSPESLVLGRLRGFSPLVISRTGHQAVVVEHDEVAYFTDKYYKPIVMAFQMLQLNKASLQFKDIYEQVCLNLGATSDAAAQGIAPCPYTGADKNIKGLVRSWVEERSPHSRQHYFRAGRLTNWAANVRPLLFTNTMLGVKNNACEWRPYSHVRGGGWTFDPAAAAAAAQPSAAILTAAAALYRRKGMQGGGRTVSAALVPIMRTTYTVTGRGSVTAAY